MEPGTLCTGGEDEGHKRGDEKDEDEDEDEVKIQVGMSVCT
jgi:hypothetical protein